MADQRDDQNLSYEQRVELKRDVGLRREVARRGKRRTAPMQPASGAPVGAAGDPAGTIRAPQMIPDWPRYASLFTTPYDAADRHALGSDDPVFAGIPDAYFSDTNLKVSPMATAAATEDGQSDTLPMGLAEFVMEQEGFEAEPYIDAAGYWTVGYGEKIDDTENLDFYRGMSEEWHRERFVKHLHRAFRQAQNIWADEHPDRAWEDLSNDQQSILVDFAYNLGPGGLLEFRKMRKAIEKNDWRGVSQEYVRKAKSAKTGEYVPLGKRNDDTFNHFIRPNLGV